MDHFDQGKTLFFEGLALYEQGHFDQAEIKFRQALTLVPDRLSTIINLSNALIKQNKFEAARELCQKALAIDKGATDAWSNLGLTYHEQSRHDDAITHFDKALTIDPIHAAAWNNKGAALNALGQPDAALACFDHALRIKADFAEAHSNRAWALKELARLSDALDSCDHAITLNPDLAQAHNNRGHVLQTLKRREEALTSYERAIELSPDYAEAHNNRGNILQELARSHAALDSYCRAIQLKSDYPEAHFNLALCYLGMGDFARGWAEHEWRWQSADIRKRHAVINTRYAPDWDGTAPQGALLVLPEQGVGDEIFYSGMLHDLRSRVQSVTVCVDPRLVKLYERSFADITFVSRASLTPGADFFAAQVFMGSLGRYFRDSSTALENVVVPYLRADQHRVGALRTRIKHGDRLVCGLSWVSKNADFGTDKSLRLKDLEPLLSLPRVNFVDLQYGDTRAEQSALHAATGLALTRIAEIDNFNDIDGLAALIAACDVVVTVSNTTAHLAAALGKPTLVMLPFTVGLLWYWHVDRDDSPWYPGVRLFRQEQSGDWSGVIRQVQQALSG